MLVWSSGVSLELDLDAHLDVLHFIYDLGSSLSWSLGSRSSSSTSVSHMSLKSINPIASEMVFAASVHRNDTQPSQERHATSFEVSTDSLQAFQLTELSKKTVEAS